MKYAIEMENLSRYYGRQAGIIEINALIGEGQLVGLLGPNGSGKTTTLRILAGYMPPSEGRARICGHDVFFDSMKARAHIGYLPEHNPLYPDMRVHEYLEWMSRLKGFTGSPMNRAVLRAVESCGLEKEINTRIGALSKGFRQRVGLASILLANPPVLILDEPTIGLDPLQVREFRALLQSLKPDHTLLLSSHILSEIEMICDSVLILNEGRVIASGTVEQLRAETHRAYRLECKRSEMMSALLPSLLERIPGARLDRYWEDEQSAYLRLTAQENDPRESILRLFTQAGFTLLELSQEPVSLEDVFVERIRQAAKPAASGYGKSEVTA
ncbi:MAG: ATP-binding cassette domain-containing protein [Candidatus Omnitrophica bacterium]|nr:ATP-binding cassette domain-containing protein [Candidatus Omnitrophota bacterium]